MPLKFSFNWNRTIYVNCFCTTELTQLNRLRNKKRIGFYIESMYPTFCETVILRSITIPVWNMSIEDSVFALKVTPSQFFHCWVMTSLQNIRTNAQGESNKIQLKSHTPKISLFWKIRMIFVVKSFGLVSNWQYVLQVRYKCS